MDGEEAATKIRQYEQENNLKECLIVFVGGNCIEKEITECLDPKENIRGNAFLRKLFPSKISKMPLKTSNQK